MLLDGCHEGKHTPRLSEVKCPKCGQWVDVFVRRLTGLEPKQVFRHLHSPILQKIPR